MMKILAGDWKTGDFVQFKLGGFSQKPEFLMFPGRFPYERVDLGKIQSIDHVTDENRTSIVGKAAWGAAGAVLLGPLGLLAGVLGGGNVNKRIVSLVLKDGRKALLECPASDFKIMIALQYGLPKPESAVSA